MAFTSMNQEATLFAIQAAYSLYMVFCKRIGLQLLRCCFSPLFLYARTVVLFFQLPGIFLAFLHRLRICVSSSTFRVQGLPILIGQSIWARLAALCLKIISSLVKRVSKKSELSLSGQFGWYPSWWALAYVSVIWR